MNKIDHTFRFTTIRILSFRCSEQSRAGIHIVQPQETLTDIAKRYYVSISDIKKWNRIGKNDIIKACTALIITPPQAPVVEKTIIRCSEQSSAGVHIVQPQETLTDSLRQPITIESPGLQCDEVRAIFRIRSSFII